MQKNRYFCREFLNKPGFQSIGFILAEVEHTTAYHQYDPSINLIIGDCSKHISLDFTIDSGFDRENTLYKLDLLCDTLLKFRAAVKEEIAVQTKRENRRKKNKKGKFTKQQIEYGLDSLIEISEEIEKFSQDKKN